MPRAAAPQRGTAQQGSSPVSSAPASTDIKGARSNCKPVSSPVGAKGCSRIILLYVRNLWTFKEVPRIEGAVADIFEDVPVISLSGLIHPTPGRVRIIFGHRSGKFACVHAEVLLVDRPILLHDECHHSGRTILSRIRNKGKAVTHRAVYHVALRATWRILALAR